MTENTAIEIASTNPEGIVSFSDQILIDAKEAGYFATFAVETREDKKSLYRARNNNELLRDHMGEVIEAVHFVIDSQKINDQEYGVRTVPCVHIIDANGYVYQSSSTGVVNSVIKFLETFGSPDTWEGEPLKIVCKETMTNAGNRYKFLDLVE